MGGPLRRPTKFDCGATLQQSSNIFYQKFVEINSVGSCGEEKGFKGKGIAAAASAGVYSVSAKSGFTGLPAKFFAPFKNKEGEKRKKCVVAPPARTPTHSQLNILSL